MKICFGNLFFFFSLFVFSKTASAQNNCEYPNQAFKDGEKLVYKVYYNWGVIWIPAGEATFKITTEDYMGSSRYHFIATGNTYSKYDWFFKVRDRYEAYADTATLQPFRFIRNVREGNYSIFNDYVFNYKKKKIITRTSNNNKPITIDSINLPICTYDVLTAIYYSRCIDFSKHKVNDTIPLTLVLDNTIYHVYIRYIGKEVLDIREQGSFKCIKFKPLLIEGTLFKEGEGMVVWVTDDKNKVPVYIETPIVVGSIKVRLKEYVNLRNESDAKIK